MGPFSRRARGVLLLACVLCAAHLGPLGCATSPTTQDVDLSAELGDLDATFVVVDVATDAARVHNRARAATRLIPASTFKIPHSMIALETGVLPDADSTIAWDPARDPVADDMPAAWRGDHTLASAFRHSVVWYYQEIARRIGAERMRAWLVKFNYGNCSIDGGIDRFWLDGELRISALEQAEFLERFVEGALPISQETADTMRSIMLIEGTESYRLWGKTGTAIRSEGEQLGWLVGFVETTSTSASAGRTHVFAFNMTHPRVWQEYSRERRVAIVKSLLVRSGAIESSASQ